MLLQALTAYYDRLSKANTRDLPTYGFTREKISFCIVLKPDGTLHGIEDLRVSDGGRMRPQLLLVPDRGGRAVQVRPNFLWDNTGYVLGADGKGKADRTRRTFGAFQKLHREIKPLIGNDPEYELVLQFLASWDPERGSTLPQWDEIRDKNVVFRVQGQTHYVHDNASIRAAWLEFRNGESDAADGQCLITGARGRVARLHDLVSGFPGAQTSGAAIVSFNQPAFESYGRQQGFNAPVSVESVFKYTTALGRLAAADSRHRLRLSNDTILFWTDRPNVVEDFFGPAIEGVRAEDEGLRNRLKVFFERLRQGKPIADEPGADDTRFFVAGLSPNAARLSIRFWHDTTVADFTHRLQLHVTDLAIDGDDENLPLTVQDVIAETARDPKDAPPLLVGALLRAILAGTLYPEGVYAAVLRRIKADGKVDRARAAILKAYLLRHARHTKVSLEVPVSLDPNHPDPAYQLGRLFAVFEKIQKDALGDKINATIKDRFFGAASATPVSVFPRLVRLSQHHLSAIENVGYRTTHEKRLGEICDHLPAGGFPRHLNLYEQGLFAIAYYQQTRALYQRSAASPASSTEEPSA